MLSDAARRRLVHYCRVAASSPRDSVERRYGVFGNRRPVRYIGADLRRLIWQDTEVRTALLEDDFDSLAAQISPYHGLALLDLVTAMSLEHELRTGTPQGLAA